MPLTLKAVTTYCRTCHGQGKVRISNPAPKVVAHVPRNQSGFIPPAFMHVDIGCIICGGSGRVPACSACLGIGTTTKRWRWPWFWMSYQAPCDRCLGSGLAPDPGPQHVNCRCTAP